MEKIWLRKNIEIEREIDTKDQNICSRQGDIRDRECSRDELREK